MWPFKRKPAMNMAEFVEDKPDVPCGNKVEHYTWQELEGMPCPRCHAITQRENKAREMQQLAEAIADVLILKLKEKNKMSRKTAVAEVILTSPFVPPPEYKTAGSAGFDLINNGPQITLAPGEIRVIPTGIKIKLPQGYVGLVTPRSGKSMSGFSVNNSPGEIDDDFRNEVMVIAINNGNDPVEIAPQERIAQFTCVEYTKLDLQVLTEFTPDEFNDRTGGLGSTGSH